MRARLAAEVSRVFTVPTIDTGVAVAATTDATSVRGLEGRQPGRDQGHLGGRRGAGAGGR